LARLRVALSALGVLILALFLYRLDFGDIKLRLGELRVAPFALAVVFTLLNIAVKGWRWRYLVRSVTGVNMSVAEGAGAVLAGVASASILPGRVLDLAKPFLLSANHDVPMVRAIPLVLLERLVDLAALLGLFLISVGSLPRLDAWGGAGMLGVAAAGLAVMLLAFAFPSVWLSRMERLIHRLLAGGRAARIIDAVRSSVLVVRSPRQGAAVTLLSAAALAAEVGRVYCVFLAFGLALSPGAAAFTFAGSVLAGLLALIPGGLGVTETSQAAMLGSLVAASAPGQISGAVLVDRFISYYGLVAAGAVILVLAGRGSKGRQGDREGSAKRRSGEHDSEI